VSISRSSSTFIGSSLSAGIYPSPGKTRAVHDQLLQHLPAKKVERFKCPRHPGGLFVHSTVVSRQPVSQSRKSRRSSSVWTFGPLAPRYYQPILGVALEGRRNLNKVSSTLTRTTIAMLPSAMATSRPALCCRRPLGDHVGGRLIGPCRYR